MDSSTPTSRCGLCCVSVVSVGFCSIRTCRVLSVSAVSVRFSISFSISIFSVSGFSVNVFGVSVFNVSVFSISVSVSYHPIRRRSLTTAPTVEQCSNGYTNESCSVDLGPKDG